MSLSDVLNEFEPTFRLQWYPADDNTAPNHGWTAPDWKILLNHRVYLVHSCELGKKSNFFRSLINQAESQRNETDLTHLLPASCHDSWELVLNFLYQDRVLHGAPQAQQHGHRFVTGPNIVTVENAVPLFKIAHVLRIPTLAHHCVHWMSNNQGVDILFEILSAAIKLAPGLASIEKMCTSIIARKLSQVDVDRFLSLDLSSLTQIFVDAPDEYQIQQKVCEVTAHYLRYVEDEYQEQVFLQLSPCVRQLRTKDALFLYSLSLTYGSESLSALCLPVLIQSYKHLDHTDLHLIRNDTIRYAMQFNHDETHDAMFAMDASSAADVLDLATGDFQADPMKVNRFVVEYLKRSKEKEVTFRKLSKYVEGVKMGPPNIYSSCQYRSLVNPTDALFLYSMSSTYSSERLCALCLPVLIQQYQQLDHTDLHLIRDDATRYAMQFNHDETHDAMFAMDASSAADVLDLAQRDFQADPMKVSRFVAEYLKRSKEKEVTFGKLSKYVVQVDAGDALFLYGVSTAFHSDRICSIALNIVTSKFEQFFKNSACVLSDISHFDAVCHLLDQDELGVRSEDRVFDAITSYSRSPQNQLTAEQRNEVWSTCRFALLSDEYCMRAKNVSEIPKRWLDLGLEERKSGEGKSGEGKSGEGKNWAEPSLMLKRLRPRRHSDVHYASSHDLGAEYKQMIQEGKKELVLGEGEYRVEKGDLGGYNNKYFVLSKPTKIYGQGRGKTTLVGVSLLIKGKKNDGIVEIEDLTLRGATANGLQVYKGMKARVRGCTVSESEYSGVVADEADITCDDLQVVGCGQNGVWAYKNATITLSGQGTSIQRNGTRGSSNDYGLHAEFNTSKIQLFAPLTKEQISTNSGGGRNWGGRGAGNYIVGEEIGFNCYILN